MPRSVAIDEREIEQALLGRSLAGQEIEVMHYELGQIGRAGRNCRQFAGNAGIADLLCDRLQDRQPLGVFGIADPGEPLGPGRRIEDVAYVRRCWLRHWLSPDHEILVKKPRRALRLRDRMIVPRRGETAADRLKFMKG